MNSGANDEFLRTLATEAETERHTFSQCWAEMLAGEGASARFVAYMVECYHYVSFTCPLLARFEERVRHENPDLASYLAHHRNEEEGHDLWLLRDLERLGLDPERVKQNWPRRETMALIGSQLYAIDHAPRRLGHLGYIYALESAAVPVEAIDRKADRLGLPRAALSTFRAHGELDPDHEIELREAIGRHVTTPGEQAAVRDSMVMSYRFLSELILGLAMDPLEDIEGGLARLAAGKRVPVPAAQPSA